MPYKIVTALSDAEKKGSIAASEIISVINRNFKGSKNTKAVCWLHYALQFASVNENGHLQMEEADIQAFDKHLVRLRVFNQDRELHVWRTQHALQYRVRVDGIGNNEIKYIETPLILNGTMEQLTENGLLITEEKGTEMLLPFFLEKLNLSPTKRLKLVTRNYIDYNEFGQAGYVDCRFVSIKI